MTVAMMTAAMKFVLRAFLLSALSLIGITAGTLAHAQESSAQTTANQGSTNPGPIKIAVLDFKNLTPEPQIPVMVQDALTASLGKSTHFVIVGRDQLPPVLKNLQWETGSGMVAAESRNTIGLIKAVNYLVYGVVDTVSFEDDSFDSKDKKGNVTHNPHYKGTVTVTVFYTDATTAEIKKTVQKDGSGDSYASVSDRGAMIQEAVHEAVNKVIPELVGADVVKGTIIEVNAHDGFLRIDLGKNAGISMDMMFEVVERRSLVLPSGRTITETKHVAYARPVQIDDEWSKLEPGQWARDFLGRKEWRKSKDSLKADIRLDQSVITANLDNK